MAEADPTPPDQAAREARQETRKTWLTRLALVVALAAMLFAVWYLLVGRNHVSTDNAYVAAEMAQITPSIAATVLDVRVRDTQTVRKGDILVLLDPARPRIAIAEAEAELAEARRRFRQASANSAALSAQVTARGSEIASTRAALDAAQAELDKARVDLQRRQALARSGAVSGEELTSARKAHAQALAEVARAQAGVAQAEASRAAASGNLAANDALVAGSTVDTDPGVLAAKAKLAAARLDLDNSVIRAPIDGVVTRRQIQVGQRTTIGATIMAIVPVAQVYVDANFKERQLRRVRVGMPATVTADLYGSSVTYRGRVVGLAGGTGSSMALIPAQNATGNWIKVVQRLPVRIALDPRELAEHPLRVGLSAEVDIDLSGS